MKHHVFFYPMARIFKPGNHSRFLYIQYFYLINIIYNIIISQKMTFELFSFRYYVRQNHWYFIMIIQYDIYDRLPSIVLESFVIDHCPTSATSGET